MDLGFSKIHVLLDLHATDYKKSCTQNSTGIRKNFSEIGKLLNRVSSSHEGFEKLQNC
jgi:hypothetical protein